MAQLACQVVNVLSMNRKQYEVARPSWPVVNVLSMNRKQYEVARPSWPVVNVLSMNRKQYEARSARANQHTGELIQ